MVDFGLSEMNSSKLNERGNLSGTAEYLSPELISLGESGMVSDWWSLGILTYEILVGRPPFTNCNDNQKLFSTILKGQINYPKYLSDKAVDFMKKLLTKSPYKRMGYNGANEVKNHEFLSEIDFDQLLMKKVKPPFIPKLEHENSVNYIDKSFLDMTPVDSFRTSDIIDEYDPFLEDGFSYNNSNNSYKFSLNLVKKTSVQSSKSRNLSKTKPKSNINSNNINSNAISNINTNANPNFKKKSFNNDEKLLNIIDSTPKKYVKISNTDNDTESESSKTEEYLFEKELEINNFSDIKKKYGNNYGKGCKIIDEIDDKKVISKFNTNFKNTSEKAESFKDNEAKNTISIHLNTTLYSTNNISENSSKDFNTIEKEKDKEKEKQPYNKFFANSSDNINELSSTENCMKK